MKFVPIDIQIPHEVKDFIDGLQNEVSDVFVVGGFIFDLLNNYPYKDIDFLISEESENNFFRYIRKFGSEITDITGEYYDVKINDNHVFEFMYNGIRMNAILAKKGLSEISRFDIRMRQMYYHGGQAYATEVALLDIKDRAIRFGSPHCPIRSLERAIRFKNKYQYEIDPVYKVRLFDQLYFRNKNFSSYISNYLSSCKSDALPELVQMLEPYKTKSNRYDIPFSGNVLIEELNGDLSRIPSLYLDKLYNGGFIKEEMPYQIKRNPYIKRIYEINEELKSLYKDLRMKETLNNEEWNDTFDEYSEDSLFSFTILPFLLKNSSKTSNLYGKYKAFDGELKYNSRMAILTNFSSNAIVSNDFLNETYIPLELLDGYSENKVFKIEFPYGVMIYNIKNSTIYNFNVDNVIYNEIKEDIPKLVYRAIEKTTVS